LIIPDQAIQRAKLKLYHLKAELILLFFNNGAQKENFFEEFFF